MFNSYYDELLVFEWHLVIYPPFFHLGIFTIALNHLNFVASYQIKYILYVYLVVVNKVNWIYFFQLLSSSYNKKLYLGTDSSTACISTWPKELSPHT